MSRVDVLAVMESDAANAFEARRILSDLKSAQAARLTSEKTRAAVAELIEAAHTVERMATRHDGDDRMFDRLHAALAKVQP